MVQAIEDASRPLVFDDDPFHLAAIYEFFSKKLPEPPDGPLKRMFALSLILFVYLFPVARGLLYLWVNKLTDYTVRKNDKNIFISSFRRRRRRLKPLPELNIKLLATNAVPQEESFSWDTDGIPFVIDNSATAIISND